MHVYQHIHALGISKPRNLTGLLPQAYGHEDFGHGAYLPNPRILTLQVAC